MTETAAGATAPRPAEPAPTAVGGGPGRGAMAAGPARPGGPLPRLGSGLPVGSELHGGQRRAPAGGPRHPHDPEPVRSTKAAAALVLGIAAVVTGPLVGGIVPGAVSLMLARQASHDIAAGRGYLVGGWQVRTGRTFAWVGIALAVTALVVASIIGIMSLAAGAGQDFPDTSN